MPAAAPRGNGPAPGRSFRQGDEGPRSSGLRCIPMRHAVGCAAHRSGSDAMRKIMLLAAIVAALGMAPQSAEARDRGFSLRHFSGARWPEAAPATPWPQVPPRRLLWEASAFQAAALRSLRPQGFAFKFGYVPHFKPRRFGHFGQGRLVLKFGDGDFVLKFGHMPHFKHHHFGHRHRDHRLASDSVSHGTSVRGTTAALPSRLGWASRPLRQSMPGSQVGQSGRVTPRCAARSPPQSARADGLSARARASAQPRSLKNGAASAAPAALREVAEVNIQGPIDPS